MHRAKNNPTIKINSRIEKAVKHHIDTEIDRKMMKFENQLKQALLKLFKENIASLPHNNTNSLNINLTKNPSSFSSSHDALFKNMGLLLSKFKL